MTEPTELRGIEGRDAAFADPNDWQCSRYGGWESYIAWRDCSFVELSNPALRWRRIAKPEPVRPTEAELVAALRAGKEIREFTAAGHVATYQVRSVLMLQEPSSVTWRSCATELSEACATWFTNLHATDVDRHWAIIDPQPAQPEPAAEMTAKEAVLWLSGGENRFAIDRDGWVWRYTSSAMCMSGSVMRRGLRDDSGPFTRLLPATRTQVALEKELAESRAASKGLELACDGLREQLRTMTGTANERNGQCKALAAALDQERAKSRQQAETIATLRDAMGHAMSSLGAACFPDSGVANAYNWLNSALNRTKEQ